MVQFLSIIFFLGFLQFLLGFSKVPVFFVSFCITALLDSLLSVVGPCYVTLLLTVGSCSGRFVTADSGYLQWAM